MASPDKTILITGASGGIGKALTRHFAGLGYNLALNYNNNKIDVGPLKRETGNNNIFAYKANVANEEEVKQMVNAITHDIGGIDILINNAGIAASGVSWKLALEDWQAAFDINVTGVFLATKHCLPNMRQKQWGRVLNISSVLASHALVGAVAYSASKAALAGYVKTVAKEVAEKNITVNNVALGFIDAGMPHEMPESAREAIRNDIPMKKFGDPKEACHLIEYIISDNATFLTGQTIGLNGGMA